MKIYHTGGALYLIGSFVPTETCSRAPSWHCLHIKTFIAYICPLSFKGFRIIRNFSLDIESFFLVLKANWSFAQIDPIKLSIYNVTNGF